MRIDSEQLAQHLTRGLEALYTVVADEPLLALEAGDRLRARARELGHVERTVLVAEPGFDWGALAQAGASLSLFARKRLIELRIPNGKPGVTGAAALERYCAHLAPDTVTLVHLPGLDWKAAQASWVQALERAGVLVEARTIARERLPQWLAGRLAMNAQSADPATLAFIAERVEGNLTAAWQEVQKLSLMLPAGKLEDSAVRMAVLDVARFEVGDLTAALLTGDRPHYVRVVNGLAAEGAAPALLLWALANELRATHRVLCALARRQTLPNALRECQVFGPRRALIERAARRWRPAETEAALLHAARIDRIVKGIERGDAWDEIRELGLALMPNRSTAPLRARNAV
ncbi:MAG: DNA polymerase III subunit delta [Burkholderiales bacterium]|nr:DNA polymerase III subunit delta [Burkholderiales bacterium]